LTERGKKKKEGLMPLLNAPVKNSSLTPGNIFLPFVRGDQEGIPSTPLLNSPSLTANR
jgi:hypothetical protein